MFQLFGRVNALDSIKSAFSVFVRKHGAELVRPRRALQKGSEHYWCRRLTRPPVGNAGQSASPRPSTALRSQLSGGEERDKTLVEDLIAFKDQMDTIVDTAFQRRPQFQNTLKVGAAGALRGYAGCGQRPFMLRPPLAPPPPDRPLHRTGSRRALKGSSTSARTSRQSSSVRSRAFRRTSRASGRWRCPGRRLTVRLGRP